MKKILVIPSAQFRKHTTSAVLAIALFIVVYFLMVISAIAILCLCVLGAIALVSFHFNFALLMLALGLVSLGVLIVLFLFKFLFKSYKVDRSHLVELDLNSQPILKEILEDIIGQVGTQFPRRVYLSNEVNASVFYDSNLLSMIFPTRKNLTIGMGLVNTLSVEEFKAVLAHEFGHFSQSSMKVGSYVYYVNELIYNLLYENDSYESLASKWAGISGYFSLFVGLAFKVAQGAQWVLKGMYSLVNKNFMALSREMEFHADEIAAYVTGGEPLANSFHKFSPASLALQDVFNYYDNEIPFNRIPQNIYNNHRFVMEFLFSQKSLEYIPVSSELMIKDQWASHPTDEDRIERLMSLHIPTVEGSAISARTCFVDIVNLEVELTSHLLSSCKFTGEAEFISQDEFEEKFTQNYFKYSYPQIFNGYYDYRNPTARLKSFDLQKMKVLPIENLFSGEAVNWVNQKIMAQSDLEILNHIETGRYQIKTFDFRGKRFKKSQVRSVIDQLEDKISKLTKIVEDHDQEIFQYFLKKELELQNPTLLEGYYKDLEEVSKEQEENSKLIKELNVRLEFTSYNTPFIKIQSNFREIKKDEGILKEKIRKLLLDKRFEDVYTIELKEIFEQYVSKEWTYFENESYLQNNLNLLLNSLDGFSSLQDIYGFQIKKGMLLYMESLETGKKNHRQELEIE
ncbi:M48 family metallopeptidase [Algoriphagus sp. PAP.12]|uniref:M48 family metallopeptidase n=1 Tax=Algoriphagus sp. PAP.12 TaxID=2996678 RepID=UPI00227A7A96|nr:M48 family metalloprotease [Algoriphagus sp. PAP.12]